MRRGERAAAAARAAVEAAAIHAAATALRRPGPRALLLGGAAVREEALLWAGRIAAKTGCTVLSEYNTPRLQRGAGRVVTQRVPYVVDSALALLKDLRQVVLVGAKPPVGFFAYPGQAQPAGAARVPLHHPGGGGRRHRRRVGGSGR